MQVRRATRPLSGVLLLDKAPGASSNAALQQARHLFRAAKAGHGGTLDPLASGLLPIMFGEATKFSSDLIAADKSYAAEIRLGISTTTADAEGETVATRAVDVSEEQLAKTLERLRGTILQVPPIFSALKHAGKPLYAYARAGIDVERVPRPVTISVLELQWFVGDRLALAISCSKGTYIRSIAHDLGEMLGCGAHLVALRRTRVGRFALERAYTLESLTALSEVARDASLLPADALLQDLPELHLDSIQQADFLRGQAVQCSSTQPGRMRVYGPGRVLLGLGEARADGQVLPKRVISTA